jgi:NIMA (never in mitosis gene a)-related kinase
MTAMTCDFLDLYDTLQVIGHGAFGIVRKVRRKSNGMVRLYCGKMRH